MFVSSFNLGISFPVLERCFYALVADKRYAGGGNYPEHIGTDSPVESYPSCLMVYLLTYG